ncbi:MAG: DUF3298 and DUF4163 domain-containing protein [Bacteroides sp.]|nr:DUF3298 and DUF4163 domain-containing protein [Bacteroides sp.]
MKFSYYLFGLPLVAMMVTGCGGRDAVNGDAGNVITEFDVNHKLLSANKDYRVETDYGTVYLEMSTSVQWPEKMGGNDISVLRDSIIRIAYNDTVSTSIHDAIKSYLNDTSIIDGANNIEVVDSLPPDSMTYFSGVTAGVIDLDESMVTYQITGSTFLGGAHPMTFTRPFTYDFTEKKVLDNSNIFLPGTPVDSVMPLITDALARQLGVSVRGLERAGVFVSQLTYPGNPYIVGNVLYFHYDPYEIGPFSMGAVDVAIYPYEIDHFLRPSVKALFEQGF